MKSLSKTLLGLAFYLMALGPIEAQERLKIDFYTRFDYNCVSGNDVSTGEISGFKGRFLLVRAEGDLGNGFTYYISHRLNKTNRDVKTFDSTDWAFLTYTTPDGKWDFSGGKLVQWVGAYEYDDHPIDVPFFSQYANHCNPYQLGVMAGRIFSPNDRLSFECNASPYNQPGKNYLSYTLMWNGHHGIWHPIYTANLYEQEAYGPMYQIALGNEFRSGRLNVNLDQINRFNNDPSSLKHLDFMTSLTCRYALTGHWTLFGKATCDYNDNVIPFDSTVGAGTDNRMYGAGFEFFPDVEHNIKLYGFYLRSAGDFEFQQNDFSRIVFGLKWKVNMITLK